MTGTELLERIQEGPILRNALATVGLFLVVAIAHFFTARGLRRSRAAMDARRRWIVISRNVAIFVFLMGAVVIWAAELRLVALSFVAFAVAFVIATKELILCVSGAVLRATTRAFSIGDRIEVGGVRGDVIDIGALGTTVLEVGPGQTVHQRTGRSIVIPNSVFVSTPVSNETFTDDYVVHALGVPLTKDTDWHKAETALLDAAREECASFIENARTHMNRVGSEQGMEPLSVEPRISIRLSKPEEIELVLRFPAPARVRGRVEQAIVRRYLASRPAA